MARIQLKQLKKRGEDKWYQNRLEKLQYSRQWIISK
jgi:hypothetical protein